MLHLLRASVEKRRFVSELTVQCVPSSVAGSANDELQVLVRLVGGLGQQAATVGASASDLFLDSFPYGAHTTCSEAIYAGLPVLTRPGLTFGSRVAASLLHALFASSSSTDAAAAGTGVVLGPKRAAVLCASGVRAPAGMAGGGGASRGGQALRLRARRRCGRRRRPRQAARRAALDRGRQGRAQAPGGRALAPKDLRSSFITFLLSDANPDEALKKAVAHAMRHSPAQQGSAAYDKEGAERTWAAAVRVATAFAARFA